jgi:hypothetical protein
MVCEFLLIEVLVHFYQPVCHNCSHLPIVATKIYLHPWKQEIVAPRRIPLILSQSV